MKTLIPFMVLMTGGCVSAEGGAGGVSNDNEPPLHGAGQCNPDPGQSLVGKPATQELGADALRLTGTRTIRWLRPGDKMTMDYRMDRLNIELDEAGNVKRVFCG